MSPSLQGGSAGPPHLFLPADHPSEEMADSILNLCLGSQSRILGGLLSRLDPDGLISVEVRSVARGFTSPSARPGVRRYSQTASPRRAGAFPEPSGPGLSPLFRSGQRGNSPHPPSRLHHGRVLRQSPQRDLSRPGLPMNPKRGEPAPPQSVLIMFLTGLCAFQAA